MMTGAAPPGSASCSASAVPTLTSVVPVVRRLHDLPGAASAPDEPVVALTFDDGPTEHTDEILDALAAREVRATFFVLGAAAERRPAVLERIAAVGHTIGNHSWSHPRIETLDDDDVLADFTRTHDLVAELTRQTVRWARPPYRPREAPRLARILEPLGYRAIVTWSVAPRDWATIDADAIVDDTVQALRPGAIVLLHDGGGDDRRATAAAVPRILDAGRARGYRWVAL